MSDQNETNGSTTNRLTSVETRRSQFRQKSASLNENRPRLIRAMSAPIRPNLPPEVTPQEKIITTNAATGQNGTRRRLRRKKIAPIEIDSFSMKIAQSQSYANKLVSQRTFDEQRPSTAKAMNGRPLKSSVKPPKPILQPRAKSAMYGCENVITLVSLLSPGASDSEKEDYSNGANDSPKEKNIPSLRKVGKSGNIFQSS